MPPSSDQTYEIDTILNQMREDYWQGLAEVESAPKEFIECLVFTLAGEQFAFETRHATEVIRVPKLVQVPTAQSLIAGVFNLRGEIVAAMDIRPLIGLSQPAMGATGRILVVKSPSFATGMLAEAVNGVQELCLEHFLGSAADAGRRFLKGQFRHDDGAITLIDMEALLASPEIKIGE